MRRRTFCKTAIAAGIAAAIPGCGQSTNQSVISAVTGSGDQIMIDGAAVSAFDQSLTGRLYMPDDEGFDSVKKIWNGMFDGRQPALIAQCESVDDVRHAVAFAAERNMLVSVRGGGHSFPGKSTCDDGLVIDLSRMNDVVVDPDARTARVAGGALLGHLDSATTEHEMITTTGIVSHTGVGGFTLGGGLGRTDRMHGLAIDNLLEATIVTAGGDVVRASEDENADLFWGIRGGGGNFGVATEFVYRLHPFNPIVYGGTLIFERSREILNFYAEFCESAPDEANIEPTYTVSPDGSPIVAMELVYGGNHSEGEAVFAPWMNAPGHLDGELGPFPYQQIQTSLDAIAHHGLHYYLKSSFIRGLTEEIIDIMDEYLARPGGPQMWFQHLGGATARVAPDATAYWHRDAAFNVGVMYGSDDPANNEAGIAAVREFYYALEPHMTGFYTNLNDDSERNTWGNYSENYPRLSQLKAQYDPTNLFRLNANVQPAV